MIRPKILLIVFLFFSVCACSSQSGGEMPENKVEFTPQVFDQLHAELQDGSPIEVIISTTRYSPEAFPYSDPSPYAKWTGWGADSDNPKSVITSMDVRIDEEIAVIWLSAYSDLANPKSLSFSTTTPNGFRLTIHGGSQGTAYIAEMTFEGIYLKHRKVFHRSFPDEVWEATEYTYNISQR